MCEGFEADDLVATIVKKFKSDDLKIIIASSDKDLAQLVSENVKILDPIKGKFFDQVELEKKFGIPPSKIVDYLALVGDASDNVPGVPGVGPKTAVKLLQQFGSAEDIDIEKITKPKLRQNLLDFQDKMPLSKKLVTLCGDFVTFDQQINRRLT